MQPQRLRGAAGDVAYVNAAADIGAIEHQIALAAAGKAHRRKVFQAWAHTGGRVAAGAPCTP